MEGGFLKRFEQDRGFSEYVKHPIQAQSDSVPLLTHSAGLNVP